MLSGRNGGKAHAVHFPRSESFTLLCKCVKVAVLSSRSDSVITFVVRLCLRLQPVMLSCFVEQVSWEDSIPFHSLGLLSSLSCRHFSCPVQTRFLSALLQAARSKVRLSFLSHLWSPAAADRSLSLESNLFLV